MSRLQKQTQLGETSIEEEQSTGNEAADTNVTEGSSIAGVALGKSSNVDANNPVIINNAQTSPDAEKSSENPYLTKKDSEINVIEESSEETNLAPKGSETDLTRDTSTEHPRLHLEAAREEQV